MSYLSRRTLLGAAVGTAAAASLPRFSLAAAPSGPLGAEIARRHDENVQRLQAWIREPCIAAEGKGYETGVPFFTQMLRDAGFQKVEQVPTSGKPGVFATLDAGAKRTLGLYFMYDVKQVDPSEWSSPPFEGRLVDKPGFGKVLVGRGAVNQKGPESTFLSALQAYRAAKRKLPVNLVLVAEGEEEIGSPHFGEVVRRPDIAAALGKSLRHLHAQRVAGPGWRGDASASAPRASSSSSWWPAARLGTRALQGRPQRQPGQARQPGVPPRPGPRDTLVDA